MVTKVPADCLIVEEADHKTFDRAVGAAVSSGRVLVGSEFQRLDSTGKLVWHQAVTDSTNNKEGVGNG